MEFSITHDMALVTKILTDKRCYLRMRNDDAPELENFAIENAASFIAVIGRQHGEPAGVFLLFPKAPAVAEIHFCLLPTIWGESRELAREFLAWVWQNTSLNILLGPVPAYNRLALELAHSVGFRDCGTNFGAVMKHGKLYDRILTEALRP